MNAGRVLLLMGSSMLCACGAEQVPDVAARPVRSVLVTGGSSGESTTYTAEIRSRYETDLAFQVGGKLVSRRRLLTAF